jgi:hypothetical protein
MKREYHLKKQSTFQIPTQPFFKRAIFILVFLMMTPLLSFSQENKVEETYLDYFTLPRESLFLHTNKTTYIVGEDIWFKVYAYDRKNENTSKATTNIHLGLYDHTGKQIDKQLILTKDGFGSGNIELNKTLESGDYYVKISTNWMKNFEENDAFAQKISIINPEKEAPVTKVVSQREYDVQFLPEGGHMVSNIRNVIGVKAIDDKGKGTKASGVIINSDGIELTTFTTNELGLGKFSFIPKRGEQYSARIVLENSKEILQELPVNDGNGIAIYVDNLRDDKTVVAINTNKQSFERLKGQQFKLLLHKDGKIKTSNVMLNSTSEIVSIDREDLFKGVNILTLFNENDQPLVERMFFNAIDFNTYDLSVKAAKKVRDSIYYAFAPKMNLQEEVLHASISVLPTGTKSYDPAHNIISSIHLKPYLKGAIENPRYYFSDNSAKTAYELDVLLLTQGWSRYSWDNIFNKTPNPNFDFENGITINGHINTDVEDIRSVLLYPTDENRAAFVEFDERGKFHLDNFYPIKGENIKLSYVDEKGKTKKPGLALSFVKRMDEDVLDINQFQSYESFYKYKNDIPEGFVTSQRELLDEIQLDAKLIQRKKARKYRLPFAGRLRNITPEIYNRYTDVQAYLQSQGFFIPFQHQIGTVGLGNALFSANMGGIAGFGGLNQLNIYGGGFNGFFIDNRPVTAFDLLNRSMTEFEDIYIWQTQRPFNGNPNARFNGGGRFGLAPFGMGNAFNGGFTVRAYTRTSPIPRFDRSKDYQNFTKVDYGFEPVKEFYTPRYIAYDIKPFQEYGVIHWEPNATIMSGRLNAIKMIDTKLEEIDVYIEGVSSNGSVFSQVIQINTPKD